MNVRIIRAPADPVCSRVSIGGNEEVGAYCVYRGSLDQAVAVVGAAYKKLQEAQEGRIVHTIDRGYQELGAS